MNLKFLLRYKLAARVLPYVLLVIALKLGAHSLGWESLSLNPLFSGIVAGNVFLMSFLLSGVLSDYKESEKLPGELAASLEALSDEVQILTKSGKHSPARECLAHIAALTQSIRKWFLKQEPSSNLMAALRELNDYFLAFESATQANFIARMKQEQSAIRRMLIRIHTIRETSFVESGYVIAESVTTLLCIGLILSKIDPFSESLFFVGVIAFFMIFLLILIRDLDNPFGYYQNASTENVSLKPIEALIERQARLFSDSKTLP